MEHVLGRANLFATTTPLPLPSAQTWPLDFFGNRGSAGGDSGGTNNNITPTHDGLVDVDIDEIYPPRQINSKMMDTYHRWMEVSVPVSLAGLPCVTVPAGWMEQSGNEQLQQQQQQQQQQAGPFTFLANLATHGHSISRSAWRR
jgi:hypothetical protein